MRPSSPVLSRYVTNLAVTLAAAALLTGCDLASLAFNAVSGSGVMKSEVRTVAPFHRVASAGSIDVKIQVGSAQTVKVEGDDNIVPLITTEVKDGELSIGTKGSIINSHGLKVTIAVPELDAVSLAGSGSIGASGVKSDSFKVELAGSGDVEASGAAHSIDIDLAGSGGVDLKHLMAATGKIDLSGSGDVEVSVSDELTASIAGSGDIVYHGKPAKLNKSVHGSGEISAAD